MLGIARETLNGREKGRGPLCFEAQLAMRALAAMKPDERLEALPKVAAQATALQVLFSRSVEAARASKRKLRAKLDDLYGRPSLRIPPVRGLLGEGGVKSARWEIWQRELAEHRRLTENVVVFARARRSVETKTRKSEKTEM
jgi:hypothetical protein